MMLILRAEDVLEKEAEETEAAALNAASGEESGFHPTNPPPSGGALSLSPPNIYHARPPC